MSTGPSGGSGGTTGPGHLKLVALLDYMRAGRARSAAAAAKAGARSTSAEPMSGTRRLAGYVRQSNRAKFTARQWRRYVHKANRSPIGAD